MDRSQYSKKERDPRDKFPSKTENRKQWILDTVRANQKTVTEILWELNRFRPFHIARARGILALLHKQDRAALLLPNGILTDDQITALGFDTEMESQEPGLTSSG